MGRTSLASQTVLTILVANHLFAKEAKCRFGVTSVDYLGHIISANGVSVDPSKIQAVKEWPIPTTHRGGMWIFGTCGYYRKFVQHFGKIAAPLHQLLTLDTFEWTDPTKDAFLNLKRALTTAPVFVFLTSPNLLLLTSPTFCCWCRFATVWPTFGLF